MVKSTDLLAIGHAAHDYIIRVPTFPKANFSSPITDMKTFNGGAAANVACVGANLGLKTALVSAVGGDFKKTEYFEHMEDLGVEYHIIPSNIYEIVFLERKEKSPCSLCSKLRRGMLNTNAIKLNCNKITLGHTADDVIHTFMLSMFFEGRLSSIHPSSYMSRTGITVIRPLILTDEREIIKEAKFVPVLKSKCPVDKHTKREEMKEILSFIESKIPIAKDRLFRAITSPESYNLFDKDIKENISNLINEEE